MCIGNERGLFIGEVERMKAEDRVKLHCVRGTRE